MALDIAAGILIAAILLGASALGLWILLEGIASGAYVIYGRQWAGLLLAIAAIGAAGWLIADRVLLHSH